MCFQNIHFFLRLSGIQFHKHLFTFLFWQFIDKARDLLDTELTALAGESYSRAYGVSLVLKYMHTLLARTHMQ